MKFKRLAAVMAAMMISCTSMSALTVQVSAAEEGVLYSQSQESNVTTEGWVYIGEDTYYIRADGSFKTGWLTTRSNSRYFFGKDGRMVENKWVKYENGDKYFCGKDGRMLRSKWLTLANGDLRYFTSDGTMAYNEIIKIDGAKFSFDKNGDVIKIVPKQTVYISQSTGVYHNDAYCSDDKCYKTTLTDIKNKDVVKCSKCVDDYSEYLKK